MHSSGLPIGIQLGARFANEHILLQLASMLDGAPSAQVAGLKVVDEKSIG